MMFRKLFQFSLLQLTIFCAGMIVWTQFPKSDIFNQDFLFGIWDIRADLAEYGAGERIVLLGGSSIGFSVSAEDLTRNLGVRTFNVGVHAGIGYENMWSLFKDVLDPDRDTIVISPEYGLITRGNSYSSLFCGVIFFSQDLRRLVTAPECVSFVLTRSLKDVINFWIGKRHDRDIYFRDAFNEYGDIVSHLGLESRTFDLKRALKSRPSVAELNTYETLMTRSLRDAGFVVVYVPTVVPRLSCVKNEAYIMNMQTRLAAAFNSEAAFRLDDLCYNSTLFFDTPYHMTAQGRQMKTSLFQSAIEASRQPVLPPRHF